VNEVWLNSRLKIWRDKSAGFLNSVFSTDMAEPFSFVSEKTIKNPDLTKKFATNSQPNLTSKEW